MTGLTRTLSLVDIGIVLAFLLYAILSGLRARAASSRNLEEYFLAGRTLRGWQAGVSMAATQFAADTPLLVTGLIATGGIFALWRLWIYALAFLFMGFVLGAAWRRAGVLTDAELAELRYGTRLALVLRGVKAVYFGGIFNCTVMAIVLFAATRIAEPFLRWNEWLPTSTFHGLVGAVRWTGLSLTQIEDPSLAAERSASNLLSLLAIVSVTTFYSTTGGLRAVVRTDLVQFLVAMLATGAYAVILVGEVGGLERIPGRLNELYGEDWATATLAFTPETARDAGLLVLLTIGIQWFAQMNADGTGYLAQRTMACRSDVDARRAAVVFTILQVVLRSLIWIPIGLSLLILVPLGTDTPDGAIFAAREMTFVEGMARYLPDGVLGLMLTGLLAALASTLDTHLNWGASYWTNDVYRRLICERWLRTEPSVRSLVWVARMSNVLILIAAFAILTQLDSIQSAWRTSLLLGSGMGVPLILRWIWWRVGAGGELGAIVASSALAPLLLAVVEEEGLRFLLMTLATTLVVVVASLFGPAAPSESVKEFYRRVRPPGFWGPVARACGESDSTSLARLRSGVLAAVAGVLSIFCVLVAAGSWLFGSPLPVGLTWRGPWIAGLLVAAAVLWGALVRRPLGIARGADQA
jgi:Na+/proline symporter